MVKTRSLAKEQAFHLPAVVAALLMEGKSKNAGVFEISGTLKIPMVVKINPESSTTARLIASIASAL